VGREDRGKFKPSCDCRVVSELQKCHLFVLDVKLRLTPLLLDFGTLHSTLGFSSSRNTWSIKVGIFGDAEAEKRANHTWLCRISCFFSICRKLFGWYVCVRAAGRAGGGEGRAGGGASAWQEQARCWGRAVTEERAVPAATQTPLPLRRGSAEPAQT